MMPEAAANGSSSADAADLRRHAERIERLLAEIQGMAGPPTWARVEELLRLLFELQGAGLERLLDHAVAAGAHVEDLERRTAADELVSNLLLLHGLHPVPLRDRVERALAAVRGRLGIAADGLTLTALGADGIARIRLSATGCGSPRPVVAQSVRRSVLDAAPELAGLEIDGADAAPTPGMLVTIGPPRDRM